MQKPRLLVIYDYFEPAYKAGGPAISCANLVRLLEDDIEVRVFTRAVDIDGAVLDVVSDKWVAFSHTAKVFYALSSWNSRTLHTILKEFRPDTIYLNGVYSPIGSLLPLLFRRLGWVRSTVVVAPCGMLQQSSLSVKWFKKRLFLPVLRWLMNQNLKLHVTSEQERDELTALMPQIDRNRIVLLGNVVRSSISHRTDHVLGEVLKLVTVALVGPMKQILEVLRALKGIDRNIEYHLYGPVHDAEYWQDCKKIVEELPENITFKYHGALVPVEVPRVLACHDVYIQPSKSENFGHSIYEALMTGLPVITSLNTPWQQLAEKDAGWNVDSVDEIRTAIIAATQLSAPMYAAMSRGARVVAEQYNETQNHLEDYRRLFTPDNRFC